jgi:hypothetical protein
MMSLLQQYLSAGNLTPDDIAAVRTLLGPKPERQPTTDILPIDELQIRLDLADQLEARINDWMQLKMEADFTFKLDNFDLAALLVAPLDNVRQITRVGSHRGWKFAFEALKPLMRICMSTCE